MSETTSAAGSTSAAGAGPAPPKSDATTNPTSATAPKAKVSEGNPAFRMMGLPRLRLPSRNWLIFLSITSSFASAVMYDKYQTRRIREKWCRLVSHIADEHLDTRQMPRKLTVYLAAPPGDGLRSAREHFHNYVKPVLVAAAMDWDVVEGRKEGDVRFKTAERIRQKRRKAGEGTPEVEEEGAITVESLREKSGTSEFDGVAGDLIVGRHTWKEYVRGLHEGWLGPVDEPVKPTTLGPEDGGSGDTSPGHSSVGDATVNAARDVVASTTADQPQESPVPSETPEDAASTGEKSAEEKKEEEKKEEKKPKPRHPPPYIEPSEYSSATASRNMPDTIGPSIGVRFPHLLGFRNTPIRIYRFLNRRHLADSVGRDVVAAILASSRPYNMVAVEPSETSSSLNTEQTTVLGHEQRDWWKTTYKPRKEHEESVWIEDMVLDERVTGRMRAFEMTADDETRAQAIWTGAEKVTRKEDEDQ